MTSNDALRLEACLIRLLPYFAKDAIALTGGVAIQHHLAAAGRPGIREGLADLDFVARQVEGSVPGIARDSLISHDHRAGAAVPKALLQLVDPVSRLRIDIFPDLDDVLNQSRPVTFGETSLLVLNANSILNHKLRTLRKATPSSPVDPKHWRDAMALAECLGHEEPLRPAHCAPETYSTDIDVTCPRCTESQTREFSLAPKVEIAGILGYV